MTAQRAHEWHSSLKSAVECPCSHPTSVPLLLLWNFPEERICADTPQTIRGLKETSVSEFGHLPSQISDKTIADAEERLSARRKRAQTGTFSINAPDGQPRLVVTDGIGVNLLCHFIGN